MVDRPRPRRTYLEKTPLPEARARWFEALEAAGWFRPVAETVPAKEAHGRVAAAEILALRPVPHVRASAMDGIAVRASATAAARRDRPLSLRRGVDFVEIDTGDPIPPEFDAVIMVEQLIRGEDKDEGTVEIHSSAFPGQNVRPVGEDFSAGQLVVPAHARLSPEAVAACLATGNVQIPVIKRPRALVIPTGSELVPPDPDRDLPPDRYPETNSALFEGYLARWGALPTVHALLGDDEALIREAVESGLKEEGHDLVIVSAGTSKGREDVTASALARLGEVLVHGVAMHPGHPVVLGLVQGKPALGAPGYPVAAWITLDQFVRPLLERYYGCPLEAHQTVRGRLARKIYSHLGEVEFVRVRLERGEGEGEEGYLVHPLPGGASVLSSLLGADGLLEVPAEAGGLPQGSEVEVRLIPR